MSLSWYILPFIVSQSIIESNTCNLVVATPPTPCVANLHLEIFKLALGFQSVNYVLPPLKTEGIL